MAWASRWSVALRAFYRQILSSSNCKDCFFKWHRPPRKLAKEVFVKFIPAKEKTRFAKEWRKVLAKDHVIRIDSHEVFNTAHVSYMINREYTQVFLVFFLFGRFLLVKPQLLVHHEKCPGGCRKSQWSDDDLGGSTRCSLWVWVGFGWSSKPLEQILAMIWTVLLTLSPIIIMVQWKMAWFLFERWPKILEIYTNPIFHFYP